MVVLGLLAVLIVNGSKKKKDSYEEWKNDEPVSRDSNMPYFGNADETISPFNDPDATIGLFGRGDETVGLDQAASRGVMLRFRIAFDGTQEDQTARLSHSLSIGRNRTCGLVLKDPSVSREHCAILYRNGTMYIKDSNSRSGTELNGHSVVGEMALRHGDRIKAGNTVLTVEVRA